MTRRVPTPYLLRTKSAENPSHPHETRGRRTFLQEEQSRALVMAKEARAFWLRPLGPIETLLPEGVDPKRLRQMPAGYRRSYVRTVQGKAGPRTAIRLFCLECVGWQRALAITCPTRACPLWATLPRHADA